MQLSLSGSEKFPDVFPQTNNLFMFANGDNARNLQLMNIGLLPWWTNLDVNLSFWRPVSVFTHLIDQYLWPKSPMMMHAQNLFWYAFLILAVGKLYRNIMGLGLISGVALFLYAFDQAHGMPVGWIASRNAIISTLFGVLAIHYHIIWRNQGRLSECFFALVFFCLALLAGESGIAAFAYLIAFALTLEKNSFLKSCVTLAPYFLIIIIWRLIYNYLGYGQSKSSLYIDPFSMPIDFIIGIFVKAPVFLMSQWINFPSSVFFLQDSKWQAIWIFFAMLVCWVIFVLLKPLLVESKVARFWFIGMLFSLVPISATFPMDRLLFFVGIGGMALLAQIFDRYVSRTADDKPLKILKPIITVLFVINFILNPILLPISSFTTGFFSNGLDKLSESLNNLESVKGKTLIAVNAPMNIISLTFFMNSFNNKELPDHVINLAPEELRSRIEITRLNENSIKLKSGRGFARKSLFSIPQEWTINQVIELEEMKIKIVALTKDGRPLEVVYEFNDVLESDKYVWLYFHDMNYYFYSLPAIGGKDNFKQKL